MTLDLDPAVLSAARGKAKAEHISLGRAVSELALLGLRAQRPARSRGTAFPVLAGNTDHPVTDELVVRFRDN